MDIYDLRYDSDSSFLFFNNFLKNDTLKIFAHKNELFNEHILKTKMVFKCLMDEDVILNFYNFFYQNGYISLSFDCFKGIIEDFIFFHDVGKLSFSFQRRLNNGSNIWLKQKIFLENHNIYQYVNNFEANHSLSGALSFIAKYKSLLDENILFLILLSYSILGHHSSLKDVINESGFAYTSFSAMDINTISCLLLFLEIANLDSIQNGDFNQKFFQIIQDKANINKTPHDSHFSFFYNYIYSLLISADILASKEYYKDISQFKDMTFDNRINNKIKLKMNKCFFNVEYNKNINFETFSNDLNDFNEINLLRKNMLLEASQNLNSILEYENPPKILFLNMPTGGGKTNTSMKLALDILNKTNINRIIYAMPFINIIEQNYDIIKENFNLNENCSEIRKIYSATETIFHDVSDEFKSKIILQDDLFNYPVICTTFFTFFESILRTRKKNKFKISAYANSVVILDEIQSLPLLNWNSLYYIINEIAKQFNIYFIIMSATLPKFNKLKIHDEIEYEDPFLLIKNPEQYFNHYLFDRNVIQGDIKELSINNEEILKDYLLNDIIRFNFNLGYTKGLIVLNTINSSKKIFDLLKNEDFEVELLNSSLLSCIKHKIIHKVNNMGRDKNKKFILISTQTIEAGVDVSFDFVVRDFAILDSIEQVRGRCNRSRELNQFDSNKKGNVYLINLKNNQKNIYEYIYNEYELNSRILETKNILNANLNYKYNDMVKYYDNVSKNINNLEDEKNKKRHFNDRDNIRRWNNLEYSKLNEKEGIHIIDNQFDQYSLYIPINMKIFVEEIDVNFNYEFASEDILKNIFKMYEKNFIFSFNELKFLKDIQANYPFNLINGNCINGEELALCYEQILDTNIDDFSRFNIIQKEFSSIINKFLVNISLNNDEISDKVEYEFKKISYFYVIDNEYIGDEEDSLYSITHGLNDYPQFTEIL